MYLLFECPNDWYNREDIICWFDNFDNLKQIFSDIPIDYHKKIEVSYKIIKLSEKNIIYSIPVNSVPVSEIFIGNICKLYELIFKETLTFSEIRKRYIVQLIPIIKDISMMIVEYCEEDFFNYGDYP